MDSTGFAMSSQVFWKLAPENRHLFKKHTPPISSITVEAGYPRDAQCGRRSNV
jgi:hypothetical protein